MEWKEGRSKLSDNCVNLSKNRIREICFPFYRFYHQIHPNLQSTPTRYLLRYYRNCSIGRRYQREFWGSLCTYATGHCFCATPHTMPLLSNNRNSTQVNANTGAYDNGYSDKTDLLERSKACIIYF